jgi:hypothetical protein
VVAKKRMGYRLSGGEVSEVTKVVVVKVLVTV